MPSFQTINLTEGTYKNKNNSCQTYKVFIDLIYDDIGNME